MQRTILLILGAALAVGLFIVAVRSTSGQDAWVCKDGQFVEIGKSWLPKPNYPCPQITISPTPVEQQK